MINIAICDDEKEIIVQISNLLADYFAGRQLEYSVFTFTDAGRFLKSNISIYDIIFLDIKINEDNGLDVARQINICNADAIIMLVSQYHEFLPAGYKVRAFRYILKPDLNNVFSEDMDSALNELNLTKGFFEYRIYSGYHRIAYDDILYFESRYPKMYIKPADGQREIAFRGNMEDVAAKLDANVFIRVGKSFIINATHTKKISNMKAYMDNGEEINVSRDYVEQARNKLLRIKRGKHWSI